MTTPTLVLKSEYARHRGVTPAQVTHWLNAGRIRIVDGKVDLGASDAMLAATLDPVRGGRGGSRAVAGERAAPKNASIQQVPPEASAASAAVIADKTASTALKQLKLQRESGRLVNRDAYDLATMAMFAELRDQLLAIPRRLGLVLAAETSGNVCTDLLAAEITKVLNASADTLEAYAERVGETRQ